MPHAAGPAIAESHAARPWVGQSIPRVEDAALLTGRGRFIDDLGVRPGTLYAAILRSPHAHAEILSIDSAAALRADGVVAVLTGDDIKALTTSLVVGVKAPIEPYGVLADYNASEAAFDILANFQGPFSIHAVISRALKVPGNRVRLRTPPDSGGSFGVKQGVFPYIVLLAAASRAVGRPVKWIEDRLEHLTASVSATNRATTLAAAVAPDGRISPLDWH